MTGICFSCAFGSILGGWRFCFVKNAVRSLLVSMVSTIPFLLCCSKFPTENVSVCASVVLRPVPTINFPAEADCNSPSHWEGDTFFLFNSYIQPFRSAGPDLFKLGSADSCRYDTAANGHRWLECTWKDSSGTLYGWYHMEPFGLCPGTFLTAPLIGSVISFDNGRTFRDLGTVIEPRQGTLNCDAKNGYFAGGNGDNSIMLDAQKEYFYFFISVYAGDVSEQGVCVARMRYADRDNPAGKVWKWYLGAWDEPGIGGYATPIFPAKIDWAREDADSYWGPSIHWNSYLSRYVILLNHSQNAPYMPQEGIYISYNDNLANPDGWTMPEKMYNGGRWYPQIVGMNKNARETDKLAGKTARFYMSGESSWEITFLKPEEQQ
jgi:hypothetical protein